VGIAGAVTSATDFTDPTGRGRCSAGPFGFSSSNGVLIPNVSIQAAHIRDGLTNTILLGEQSDWITAADGSKIDQRSSNFHGAWIGAGSPGYPENGTWNDASGEARYYNTVTLRYAIGHKTDAGPGQAGMQYGYGGANMPVQSVHVGGAFVARCDGGVTFLENGTDWNVVQNLAIRDDGNAIDVPLD
jgi:hypothetical protein